MVECGLTNLATCLPEKFFEFVLSLLNAPLQGLLYLVKSLLTEAVNINIFHPLWAIIIYIISLFYGIFFIFAGFNFIISGYDAAKRENAKSWITNIVLMIIFIQASFYIYDLIVEIGSLLTLGVVDLINPEFFLLTNSSFESLGLQLMLMLPYALIILTTLVLLGFRYLLVSIGVVLFPLAIFFYFLPPLRAYGKMILNVLLTIIFVTFFDAIILFGASALTSIEIFENYGILVPTIAFLTIDLLMVFLLVFAMLKAALSAMNSDFGTGIKKVIKGF